MRLRAASNLVCLMTLAAIASDRVVAAPASQPAMPNLAALLDDLAAADPTTRDAGRDGLMQLSRADLPALRDAAATLLRPANPPADADTRGQMIRAALHEIVVHVYLTGVHEFRGQVAGILGFTALNDGASPIVLSRRPGYDAYRALQDGDTVVGLSNPRVPHAMQSITNYATLLQALSQTRVGDRVTVRLIRNGQPIERTVRIGPPVGIQIEDPNLPIAELYWSRSFEPALRGAPTTEATDDGSHPTAPAPRSD